jgi:hypothetical protein
MTDVATVDFLTDRSLVPDPYPHYDYLRAKSLTVRLEPHGFVAVTGYKEALEVYENPEAGLTASSSSSSHSGTANSWPSTQSRSRCW